MTAAELISGIREMCRRLDRVQIMEICGTHTVSLLRSGVKSLLPANLRLVSGPGCPVCVTSQGYIDAACELAERPYVTICTYGDMLRVPGRCGSLETQRAVGADVVIVYSARDAVRHAREHPERLVVFLAVGFETTAPATAAAILEAERGGLENFCVLPGHKLVIPAMQALLSTGETAIDGFLCPGHVSVVIGSQAYAPIVAEYHKPCVIAGFEPLQLLRGIHHLLRQMTHHEARLENVYSVAVADEGNAEARRWLADVLRPGPAVWRAMGTIPSSGLDLRPRYRRFDVLQRLSISIGADYDPPGCRCGQVIQGRVEPGECPLFGNVCTPSAPIGPCMVSSEGTCAAFYKYDRFHRTRARSAGTTCA
jgi:hydrogenase expression/formation protein HypD